ncbi:MAG: hypothetical protein ABSG46_03875 [Candidatus Binataceae bacterium]
MKLPEIYSEWRVVFGVALLILGIGNWVVGWEKAQLYGQLASTEWKSGSDQNSRTYDELDGDTGGVLAPLTDEQREVSYARARMDFYHATFLTGRVLVIFGLLFACAGFLSLIRNDSRRAMTRLNLRVKADGPFTR